MKSIFLYALCLLPLLVSCAEKQVYIVRIRQHNGQKSVHEIEETHFSYLLSVKENEEEARASFLYCYQHSINGFAAELTPDEASKLSEMEEVALVYKSDPGKYKLQTTRSWEFVGLDEGGRQKWSYFNGGRDLLLKASYGQQVIVGVVDSGVWPESESFSDEGMEPVPKSWKGICQTGVAFNSSHCNRKIIGARYYLKGYEKAFGRLDDTVDYRSPRDADGHGTHTASTVAGRRVHNASLLGLASGTASGGAPLARLAIYKACWSIPNQEKSEGNTCIEEDMLAAIDDAIKDGVHVLSISIGASRHLPLSEDAIASGALNALRNEIVAVCAAGNLGPDPATLSNYHPWVITVGASSLDRDFIRSIQLGNGMEIMGRTATTYELDNLHPLVYAADAVGPGVDPDRSAQCIAGSLAPQKVRGKIVMCMIGNGVFRVAQGMEVKRAGGVGLILGNLPVMGNTALYDTHVLPATEVSSDDVTKIIQYIRSTNNSMAIIKNAVTLVNVQPSPYMTLFSGRGPNPIDPNILKPDITAPGLNILAAWSEGDSVSKLSFDNRTVKYNLESGTSMATPHVAAAAALLKAVHPNWSSAAVRSAIMTTAWMRNNQGFQIIDQNGNPANPFMLGSGHFRPIEAANPGLVYDASLEDYLLYVCNIGEDTSVADQAFVCPNQPPSSINLNYPSLAISNLRGVAIVNRTVTNVGSCSSNVYIFSAEPPMGILVNAFPNVLRFDHVGQKLSFTITVSAVGGIASEYLKHQYGFGSYSWTNGFQFVTSPMAVALA